MKTVAYSATAKAEVAASLQYLNDRNPVAAKRLSRAIEAAEMRLREHPLFGKHIAGSSARMTLTIIYGYRILYFRHGARRFPKGMSDR
jgi:plasmid stabilization system protein ParE